MFTQKAPSPLSLLGTRGLFRAHLFDADDPKSRPCPVESGQISPMEGLPFSAGLVVEENPAGVFTARLQVVNRGNKVERIVVAFESGARPGASTSLESLHLPLTMNGVISHPALTCLGTDQLQAASHHWLWPAQTFSAHYLEPALGEPGSVTTKAPLLIPLITLLQRGVGGLSFFASPERGWAFMRSGDERGEAFWRIQTVVTLSPGENWSEKAWLSLHGEDPREGWKAFHRLAAPERTPGAEWLNEVRGHYFDFLSAESPGARRGGGYLTSAPHFRTFGIGLGTQHGYYPHWGDYVNPSRPDWIAMPADVLGGAPMSLAELRARIALTRREGARAAIYIHLVGFDDASPLWKELGDCCRLEPDGTAHPFYWKGPDVLGTSRFMSIAAPAWRDHLLRQARWIFELLDPDAIVVDESFGGLGYDHHPDRRGPTSPHAIRFFKSLMEIARSFGPDKAVLTSDCAMSGFALWADGEAGDHAYAPLLGSPHYREKPVRYRAVLGDKPWLPCAWLWQEFWDEQMDLSRKAGAAVGFANGWLDHAGLALISPANRQRYLDDLARLKETIS